MMPKPVRNAPVRTQSDKNRVATLTDGRPMAAVVEGAGPTSVDVSAAIRKRPLLAAAPILLALLIGVPYALRSVSREYHAEAAIYVSPTYFKNFQDDREQLQISYATLVNQQILTIRRYDILSEALKRSETLGVQWRTPGESEPAAIARLTTALDVRPIPDSYEVVIGLSGSNQKWLAPMVNSIANAYLDREREEQMSDRSSRVEALTTARAKIDEALKSSLDQQSGLSEKLMVANLDKAPPVDDMLLSAVRQAREEARRKRIEAEAQISIMEPPLGGVGKDPLTAIAEETVANDSGLRMSTNYLLQRTFELKARIEGLTSEHPLRQATEKEIAGINDQLTQLPRGLVKDASSRLRTKLHADVERARLLESELNKEVEARSSNVRDIAQRVQQAQGLGGEIERLRKSRGTIDSALELAMQDSPARFLRMFSAAEPPIAPSKTSLEKNLGLLAAIAILFSIALCTGMDLFDQRILSPFEVKRAVGFTPLGLLLKPTPGTEAFAQEQFWRLVNGIQREITLQDAKSIVLTPLRFPRNPRNLVADIATALTACGLKTGVIDANPRSRDDRGLGSLTEMSALGEIPGTIQNTNSPVPTRMEIGVPRESSRVPVVDRSIVDKMTRDYDVVLIDAPALLLCADTEFLTVIGDVTLVVVETGDATRSDLIQATNLLKRIGAQSIGIVMSQLRLGSAGKDIKRDFKRFSSRSLPGVPVSS
jgi:succinoglycan biosynthesis transport protein ExoP